MHKTLRILLPVACVGALAATAVFAVDRTSSASAPLVSGGSASAEGRPLLPAAFRRIADELALTDAQRAAAKDVIRQHYAEVRAALDRARIVRAELRGVIRSGDADEAALAAAADKVADAAREVALVTARLRIDLRLVLDDAQRAKIEEIETRLRKRFGPLRESLAEEFGPA